MDFFFKKTPTKKRIPRTEKEIEMMVDVKGIDKKELLRALWDNAGPPPIFLFMPDDEFDSEKAMRQLENGYAKYICDRHMDVDLKDDDGIIYPTLYDRRYGEGSLMKVVEELRKKNTKGRDVKKFIQKGSV